jgi:TetR/AcrR family transcriptional regulator, transcriptional repressor of aconitase
MPKRSDDYLNERREQILAGARAAFARHGFEATTIAVLEKEIGVSRGAIFHYWPNKLAIFLDLADRDSDGFMEGMPLDGGPEAVVEYWIDRFAAEPDWIRVYFEAGRLLRHDPELIRRWRERSQRFEVPLVAAVEEWQRQGIVRDDLTAEQVMTMLFTLTDGLGVQLAWAPEPKPEDYRMLPALAAAALAPPKM